MPSIEVGTVGGGTSLPAQAAALDIMGVRGAARAEGQAPGDNAKRYQRFPIVCPPFNNNIMNPFYFYFFISFVYFDVSL